ncbi:MAG: hypothetical protein Fur0022_14040 [Anaerolineales bacterium]
MNSPNLQVPAQFASVFGIGAPKAVFEPKGIGKWSSLIIGLVLLGAAGITFVVGSYMTYSNYTKYGPATLNQQLENIFLPTVLIAGILFLISLITLWSTFTNWRKAAVVYADGFAYSDHKGVRTFRWDQITGMTSAVTRHYRNGIYTGTTHLYTLWDAKGNKLAINDSLPKVEELSNMIREATYRYQYQAAADSYNAGHKVQFGPITISKADGITIQKKSYKWDEVGQVSIEQGYIKVAKKGGGWFSGASAMIAVVPNYEVLLSIVHQVVGVKTH